MDSILTSIKKMLGVDEYCEHFDPEIIMHINSALTVLNQLGVGPTSGFFITGSNETWDELIPNQKNLEFIKSYLFMKVKLIFDPPSSSSLLDSMSRLISELEWRIQVAADPVSTNEGEEETSKWSKTS